MHRHRIVSSSLILFASLGIIPTTTASTLQECRLLRQPDIQGDRIVFVYGGDLWMVARDGGVAGRLTTHDGVERFPKISPDGRSIAFTAEYDGNIDAYTIPAAGGEPRRLTWHPATDQVAEWYPQGDAILLRSPRAAATRGVDRFFRVPADGGFEAMLSLPTGGYATFSPEGRRLAFVSPSYDGRTWKRYKGGNAPEIWLYDLERNISEKITDWAGADEWPMWHGDSIYYSSDRGGRTVNLWAYDVEKRAHRQVTQFDEFDVKWPSIGDDAIVFEYGGYLYVMDLPAEKARKIQVMVPDDKPGTRAELRDVATFVGSGDLSPSAKRAVLEARGDIFTVPAKKGDVRNLTRSPGVRERAPVWSPDGRLIAYLSDRSGEYEIHVVGSDGSTAERQVTQGADTYRYDLVWSPDSKKIAFSDKTLALYWVEVESGRITEVDRNHYSEIREFVWSGDSRWLAYAKSGANYHRQILLHSLDSGESKLVSGGMFDDFSPAFDTQGKYLYFVSRRTLNPRFGIFDVGFQFSETDKIYAVTLKDSLRTPVPPMSDEEPLGDGGDEEDADDEKEKDGKEEEKEEDKESEPEPWTVDLEGIASRVAEIPVPAARYDGLSAIGGKLVYLQLAETAGDDDGDEGPGSATIKFFDLEEREEKTVIAGVKPGYALSRKGDKLLYRSGESFGIIDVAEGSKPGDGALKVSPLMAVVDPAQEWLQMFNEAWRLERDYYYDPNMGGIDWAAIGERYRQLVPFVAHRTDLNYILGELIGELSTSHAYVGGGDAPKIAQIDVGLLGADYELDQGSGRYRIRTIYRERDWNSPTAAPLGEPGIDVREGDYLLEVNGRALRAPDNLYAAFEGTTGKITTIKVGSTPADEEPRTYTVVPIGDERSLRYTAWVAANRRRVDEATGGRVAYIHVPNTAIQGIQEFNKQFYPQVDRDGIIVDERFNGGGFIPDFFIERLQRKSWVYWSTRDGADFRTPSNSIDGPKCILINEYAGSGGDAFPYFFRLQGLGPVIGKRTWGGLVGISQIIPLVDGGVVTMPDFGMWDPAAGEWLIENHGTEPDIEVENAPHLVAAGSDPQLERAIEYVVGELTKNPPRRPARPEYKIQR
ncbi:MAG TPA: S41 family peptidase [Candidatus Polarisedimenticolia bacterium]|nr:S41 family peptidase [Candidatus Polarisedimenticolia bacterium]